MGIRNIKNLLENSPISKGDNMENTTLGIKKDWFDSIYISTVSNGYLVEVHLSGVVARHVFTTRDALAKWLANRLAQ